MTSIVPLVAECEAEFGSIKQTPINDKRLVKARKFLNHGVDPFENIEVDFDVDAAQKMLDKGLYKQDIAEFLNTKPYKISKLIYKGVLDDSKWLNNKSDSKTRYVFYKNGDYQMRGTMKEISALTGISVSSLKGFRTNEYKKRNHRIRYRLVEID